MKDLFTVFRRNLSNGHLQTVGEFQAPNPDAAIHAAVDRNGTSDELVHIALPSAWFGRKKLDKVLRTALH